MYIIERKLFHYGNYKRTWFDVNKISIFQLLKKYGIKGSYKLFKENLCGFDKFELSFTIRRLVNEEEYYYKKLEIEKLKNNNRYDTEKQ